MRNVFSLIFFAFVGFLTVVCNAGDVVDITKEDFLMRN